MIELITAFSLLMIPSIRVFESIFHFLKSLKCNGEAIMLMRHHFPNHCIFALRAHYFHIRAVYFMVLDYSPGAYNLAIRLSRTADTSRLKTLSSIVI